MACGKKKGCNAAAKGGKTMAAKGGKTAPKGGKCKK